MTVRDLIPTNVCESYLLRLQRVLCESDWSNVSRLAAVVRDCWLAGRQVMLCGNGGSAGNAMHIANDLVYGVAKGRGPGVRALALSANPAVVTCLGNDLGYEHIYAAQIAVHGQPGDLLIALSGSGNSPNIVRAVEQARQMGIKTCAVLGYSGGKVKALVDLPIHFAIDDMQISEDLQLIVAHMTTQWLQRHSRADEEAA